MTKRGEEFITGTRRPLGYQQIANMTLATAQSLTLPTPPSGAYNLYAVIQANGGVLLLPKLTTNAWDSGRLLVTAIPHEVSHAQVVDVLASLVRLLALALPVAGSVLVSQKIVRTTGGKALAWSGGRPFRRGVVVAGATIWYSSARPLTMRVHSCPPGKIMGTFQVASVVKR